MIVINSLHCQLEALHLKTERIDKNIQKFIKKLPGLITLFLNTYILNL